MSAVEQARDGVECAIRCKRGELVVDVELSFGRSLVALVGPSGAGKSSVLFAIAGLIPMRGHVRVGTETWCDEAGLSWPTHRRRVGLVSQKPSLFPHLGVLANVAFGASGTAREKEATAKRWLERMQARHLSARGTSTLSGGEIQRVSLARALAREPKLLLLDESFAALHTSMRAELARHVRDIVAELDIAALLVTHDEGEARAVGERLFVMENGKITSASAPRNTDSPRP